MYGFVLTRRWLGFALLVAVLATVCARLGVWQLDRLDYRLQQNTVIAANLDAPAASIATISTTSAADDRDKEWRPVAVTGTYDTARQVVLKYQTRDGRPGVDVITPLVTDSGQAVLIDRGWIESPNNAATVTDVPVPPPGTVEVTGWWRPDSGASANAVEPVDGQVRAISSTAIAPTLGRPVYGGYLNLLTQEPAGTAPAFEGEPRPEMGQGPHFFYALQWFFFAALAAFGWLYFAWTEAHPRIKRPRRNDYSVDAAADDGGYSARIAPPSTGSMTPETYDAAGDSKKAAARPSSSG